MSSFFKLSPKGAKGVDSETGRVSTGESPKIDAVSRGKFDLKFAKTAARHLHSSQSPRTNLISTVNNNVPH